MFTRLTIKNFKPLKSVVIKLAPLTILIGPNNAGKSSFLHFLAFLKQSNGKNPQYSGYVNLNSFKDTVYRKEVDQKIKAELRFTTTKEDLREVSFMESLWHYGEISYILEIADFGVERQGIFDKTGHRVFETQYLKVGPTSYSQAIFYADNKEEFTVSSADHVVGYQPASRSHPPKASYFPKLALGFKNIIQRRLQHIFLVPANRGIFDVNYKIKGNIPPEVLNGSDAINVLFFLARNREAKEVYSNISKWISNFGLTDILPGARKGQQTGLDGIDPANQTSVDAIASGFGVNQLIPLIVQCFYAPEGSLILIEDPEIHLHPKHQIELVSLFKDVIGEKKQLIVTTHSEHILMRLQRLIAQGEMPLNKVAVYYIHREDGMTKADRLKISKDGSIKGGLPGFFEVNRDELLAWAKALAEME